MDSQSNSLRITHKENFLRFFFANVETHEMNILAVVSNGFMEWFSEWTQIRYKTMICIE